MYASCASRPFHAHVATGPVAPAVGRRHGDVATTPPGPDTRTCIEAVVAVSRAVTIAA